MMPRITYITISIMIALSGCSNTQPNGNTLASLKKHDLHIKKSAPDKVSVDTAIDSYEKLVLVDDPRLSVKTMHRLGDLEMERIAQILEQSNGHPLKSENFDKAIEWYKKVLLFKQYPEREDAYYQLAHTYEQSGRIEEAIETLRGFSRSYPASSRIAETNFRLGEILFKRDRFKEAEAAYNNVIALGNNNSFYELALFKHAWSLYKQENCLASLDAFFAVFDLKLSADATPTQLARQGFLSASDIEMTNEAFRAVNLCLSLENGEETLTRYLLTKPERIYEFVVFKKLADFYLSQKRDIEAAKTLQAFALRSPWHPYAALLQDEAIAIYTKLGKKELIIQGKKDYAHHYKTMYEHWDNSSRNNYFDYLVRSDKDAQGKMRTRLEVHLHDLAQNHHARAQKSKRAQDYRAAIEWYREYLNYFPDTGESVHINFLLAEALFEDKQYQAAATEYERTAYEYGDHKKAVDAAYALLVAYTKHERNLSGEQLSTWRQSALHSAIRFSQNFPRDPRTPEVLAKATNELYKNKNYDEALRTAQTIFDRYPASSKTIRRTALIVLANTRFELGNYEIAELFYIELQALVDNDDPAIHDINERLAAAIYKQAESFRDQGAIRSAISEFQRMIATVPKSSIRANAEYDIATSHIILNEWDKALGLLQDFKKSHPEHPLTKEVSEKIAVAYLKLEQPLEAASALEDIASNDNSPETQKEALLQAADLYEKAGELHKSAITYTRYADTFPSPLEPAIEALYKAAKVFRKTGKEYYYFVQMEKIFEADRTGGSERTNRTRYLAAQAAFELAEPHYERYAKVRLVEPIRSNMKLKNRLMKQALEAYNKAAGVGVAQFTTAATYRIADMYADFSRKLMDSDRPANLNEEELEQYEIMLEEQAFPFEEKAISLHEGNYARVKEGLYDDWIKKSITSLAKLMPARYARSERYEVVAPTLY